MPCESYKQALTDAAAANEAPSREVTTHLEACVSCRVFFAEEQQLFAAVESGLHVVGNARVPASLLPRVRACLDEQKLSNFSWIRVAVVLASAMLVLVGVFFLQRMRPATHEPEPPVSMVAANPAPKEFPVVAAPRVPPEEQAVEPLSTERSHRRGVGGSERAAEVAVLVPAGQREEVDKLLAALSSGTVKPDDLLVQKTASLSTNGELAPLGIPEIQIKPLAAVSEDVAPTR